MVLLKGYVVLVAVGHAEVLEAEQQVVLDKRRVHLGQLVVRRRLHLKRDDDVKELKNVRQGDVSIPHNHIQNRLQCSEVVPSQQTLSFVVKRWENYLKALFTQHTTV